MQKFSSQNTYIIDFDSTFVQVETLDLLAEIALTGKPNKAEILEEIKMITHLGMDGKLSFRESLEKRIALFSANEQHLSLLITALQQKISTSFIRNKSFFIENCEHIYIVSNGFKEFIVPLVKPFGISEANVYANTFLFDHDRNITGFDPENILSQDQGKIALLKQLNFPENIFVIGDGYNDYEIKKAGYANKFYAFTENVERENVLANADHITPSLDEFLYVHKMNKALSYPKNRINILLLENIHPDALGIMKEEGYNVTTYAGAMDEEELCEKIKEVSIIGIRSKTKLTKKVLENAHRLMAVGAFCIGTNQIDLETCLLQGIPVFNAPYSNTRSVVELALGEIILLLRNLPDKIAKMHAGTWNKSATSSFEVRGKKLGIIGYGNIGAQLSVLAENFGLDVYYYDLEEKLALGNATKCKTMNELLATVDIVSLHVDGRAENENLIDEEAFQQMQEGSVLLNLSRGKVVDISALAKHLRSGKIIGAGIDVFPTEPKTNKEAFHSILKGLPNLILTPHIGGSTQEAQKNIGSFVPGNIIDYINTGSTSTSVNFPKLQLPVLCDAHRLIHIHENKPGVLAKINHILAEHKTNISGQYLKTNESIGYVITDIDKAYNEKVIQALKKVEGTIRFRILY